jgi:hypothetical protein
MKSLRESIENHADILAVTFLIAVTVVRTYGPVMPPAPTMESLRPLLEMTSVPMQDCGIETGFRSPICPDLSPFAMGQVEHAQREVRKAQFAIRDLRFQLQ